jgi:small subunit ribosomal protein S35
MVASMKRRSGGLGYDWSDARSHFPPHCQAILDREKSTTRPPKQPHPMASIPRRLLLQSRQCPSRIRTLAAPKHTCAQWQRPISTTPRRYANEPTKEGSATAADAKPPTETLDELAPELPESAFSNTTQTKAFQEMTPQERESAMLENLRASLAEIDPSVVRDALRKGIRGLPQTENFGLETDEDFEIEEDDKRRTSAGFWAEGEESMGPDEDYYGDDLTSHGHGELQQHRELREYARLIAWELPLLSRTSDICPQTRDGMRLLTYCRSRPSL